jgi:cell division protein FtsA
MPIDFSVDEQSGIPDPKGLMGDVLGVRAVVSLVPKKNIYSVVSLVDSVGLEVVDISLGGIGDVNAFKNKETDMKLGSVINIGYETTSVSIYNKGIIIKNSIIGMGGKNIDNDLSYMYKIGLEDACSVKEKFALAYRNSANKVEFYDVGDVKINQFEATEVVMSRIEEILTLAKKEINALANRKMEYIIITGGVSNMNGFEEIAQDVFGKEVQIGNVNMIGIRNNKYSSAVGNIVYYINQLKLLGSDSTMVDDDFSEEKFNINEDSMLGKVFGYFFGDTNEEEL